MKLVTIILNWRTAEMTLRATAAALLELAHISGEWKVYLVDNDSQDGSFEAMRDHVAQAQAEGSEGWNRVEVIASGRNGGFGAGNNVGIRKALAADDVPEYFYILNSDAFPEDQSIRYLAEHLDSHPKVGIVGSYIHGVDGLPHVTAFRFPSVQSEIEKSLRLGVVTKLMKNHVVPMGIPDHTLEVDWVAGASMMVRSKVLKEVGLFDEEFFLYFEETDLCRRVREGGYKIAYVRESSVAHIGSVSTGMKEWAKVPDYWYDSRRHYFLKNHGSAYLAAADVALTLGSVAWQVRRRLQGKQDSDPPGFLTGLMKHRVRSTRT